MASSYNRKSDSSASRRPVQRRDRGGSSGYRAIRGGQYPGGRASSERPPLTSVRVGDLRRGEAQARAQKAYRRYVARFSIALFLVLALIVSAIAVYYSDLFVIETVSVTGVEHLTALEMEQLAAVQEGTTLLRVDISAIKERLLMDAWVEDVTIKRSWPNTLEIIVTERTIAAVVEVPTDDGASTQDWAIASDGMWLMPIPDQDSEAGQATSAKVYEDAAAVLRITDVPYGVDPQVGDYCDDDYVNNALGIITGMTTELADQVVSVLATEADSTTLVLESGVEIVFGDDEDIRDKERVCLAIMEEYPDVVYINVRVVDSPTWRAVT